MSSCWKCEKPLPEGQVECEDGCGRGGEDLAKELKSGEAGVLALINHLDAMGAQKLERSVVLNGKTYMVTVEIIEEGNGS